MRELLSYEPGGKTSGDVDLASMQLRRLHRTPRSRIARPSKVYQEAGQEKAI